LRPRGAKRQFSEPRFHLRELLGDLSRGPSPHVGRRFVNFGHSGRGALESAPIHLDVAAPP
jgi:hypothetical protein